MQYDQPVSGDVLNENLAANERINDATLAAINSLLNIDSSSEVAVGGWNGSNGTEVEAPTGVAPELVVITPEGNDPIFFDALPASVEQAAVNVWDTNANLDLTYNTGIERVVVLGNGDNSLTVNGDENTTVVSGGGNDTITTSAGDDHVTLLGGNNFVDVGAGADTVIAGQGYDVVTLEGGFEDYEIVVQDGQIVLTRVGDTSDSVTATNVNFFQLGDNTSITVGYTLEEAETLRLYQATLGRSADLEGAQYWLNDLEEGYTSNDIANAFLFTAEGSALNDLGNADFVAELYQNALGRDGSDAELAYWTNDLDQGATRADVIVAIANSAEGQDEIVNVKFIDGLV